MLASKDYKLTDEMINLYRQIIWEVITLLHIGSCIYIWSWLPDK
jgi:hypothetical protein